MQGYFTTTSVLKSTNGVFCDIEEHVKETEEQAIERRFSLVLFRLIWFDLLISFCEMKHLPACIFFNKKEHHI
jgi:hypothetical protein